MSDRAVRPARGSPPGAGTAGSPRAGADSRRAWGTLSAAAAAVWATLPYARVPLDALRSRGWLGAAVAASFAFAAALLVARIAGRRRPALRLAAAGALAAAAWARASALDMPEERVHLVEYGLLAVLAHRALGAGGREGAVPVVGAAALAAALGLVDEGIQGAIPSRVFDWRDVALNAEGAGLGALAAAVAGDRAAREGVGSARGGGRRPVLAAALAALMAAALVGRADPPSSGSAGGTAGSPPAYPGAPVLILTIDALRSDVLPAHGRPAATPALRRLLAESVRVEGFRADSAWTLPSVISMLTALAPSAHGVEGRGMDLAPGIATPLEAFAAAGWDPVGHFAGVEGYRHLGFRASLPDDGDPVEALGPFLTGRPFLWQHLTTLHTPYEGPVDLPDVAAADPLVTRMRAEWTVPRGTPGDVDLARAWARRLYESEVPALDAQIAAIRARLAESGLLDRCIWVITSDHGEELFERGWIGHPSTSGDTFPEEELVRIPLLVRFPDGRGAGTVRSGTASQVDLMPTLAELVGITLPPPAPGIAADGRSIAPWLLGVPGAAPPARSVVSTTSPCGWRCPPERADYRYHALFDAGRTLGCQEAPGGNWTCRPGTLGVGAPADSAEGHARAAAMEGEVRARVAEARGRAARMGTPVPPPRDLHPDP